ncbi:MocR-like pyridoxine biosynthesis transcription factor PdxR [Derxia lacustris]|uniref:MocR-like pyridoxine biosynthesis transcription factor PdxR n=1 Tax=Derxia lacustris TaxID=764842 RepID=UPI001F462202|nr:PLP-dependent aminotransferase family protein [Derxia lacustris]
MSVAPIADLLARELAEADFHPRLPMHRRLYESLRGAILSRRLAPGERLPSSRDLAVELGLSRNTVLSALNQLLAEGYVEATIGSGTYVSRAIAELPAAVAPALAREEARRRRHPEPGNRLSARGVLLTGRRASEHVEIQPFAGEDDDYDGFPFKVWQRLQARQWRQARGQLLDYDHGGGHAQLRRAVADYLRVSRSVNVTPDQVLITPGTQQSLDLCARLLADNGDLAWVENPGYWAAERVLRANGLQLRPVAVDAEGLAPDADDYATRARLVYVTPSHQYPTGVVMSLARRRALLDYAARTGAWILEDDYDAEFRYEGRPVASLQGLDEAGRVIYLGTFSKVLYPGLRIGYMVVPPAIAADMQTGLYDLQRPGQLLMQAVLAEFIQLGYFASHIRRQRQVYAERRQRLASALREALGPALELSPVQTGMHLVLYLPAGSDDAALAEECADAGLSVRPLSRYYLDAPAARRAGLVIGYAYVKSAGIEPGARTLGRILRRLFAPRGRRKAA